jgi:CheY-like chemotaxis protein
MDAVRTARNAVEALALVEARRPDVILLDLLMPVLGGWDLVHRLRAAEESAGVPLVMISALRTVGAEAARLGVTRWLQKPFRLEQLVGTVREAGQA